jgi:hypothetical protein
MFYETKPDSALRFGDILFGVALTTPSLSELSSSSKYNIEVELPDHCVILSPCCSIGNSVITVSPLLKIKPSYYKNPFFAEDLTRINRIMSPEQSVAPEIWEKIPPEEKTRRANEGASFALKDVFIFQDHPLLPKYTLTDKNKDNYETGHYMIDFKNQYKISCKKINSANDAPIDSKCIQLSIETRNELRNKISSYYSRVPVEDIPACE